MNPEKLSIMEKREYDELIENQYLCRMSYMGDKFPQIKPFVYTFDGKYIYILASKYGKKLQFLKKNPVVTLEIEKYSENLSDYKFVTLSGKLVQIKDEKTKRAVRSDFVDLIKSRKISNNIMKALGHSEDEPVEAIKDKEKNLVFKLTEVENITGIKR